MTLEAYDGTPLPPGVQKLINQLKLSDEDIETLKARYLE